MAAKTHYKATFADGSIETRSSVRKYAFCYKGNHKWPYEGWAGRPDLVPAGAQSAPAVEIDAKEYAALVKAADMKRNGLDENGLKLKKAREGLASAQDDQADAGSSVMTLNLALNGVSRDEQVEAVKGLRRGWGRYGWNPTQVAESGISLLLRYQRDQANAYRRIVKFSREIAKLEAPQG